MRANKYKNNIKEIDDNIILIGHEKYLIEFLLQDKSFDYQLIKKFNNKILEINVLPDNIIIIFTEEKIILYNKENNKYIVNIIFDSDYNQYYSSFILPNKRLLLKSFSTDLILTIGCIRDAIIEVSKSKNITISL